MAKVDVIVLNFNGRRFLGPCFQALRAQTFRDFQVFMVNNGSTDDSADYVQAEFPEVRVITLAHNVGFCGANNRGIEATSGEYVALLNNDTEVTAGWLKALVTGLERDPTVGLCASKMIRLSDRMTIDTAGDVFYTHGAGGKRGSGRPATEYMMSEFVFGACAGAALYRRVMLVEIGLLDEDLFGTDEDIDLSFRARLRGYQCQYVPDATVYHHVSATVDPLSGSTIRRTRRNMVEVLLKNMPTPLLLKHALSILGYYVCGDIYYSLRGYGLDVLLARWENLRRLPRTLAKRRAIQAGRAISARDLESVLVSGGFAGLKAARERLRYR